jgi:SAM-dependent methyltransferase
VTETLPPLPGLDDALAGEGGTFVEVGAGYGVRVRDLLDEQRLARFSRIVLTDLDAERVAQAQRLVPEAETVACDAMALPFANSSVDFVFSDQVIEHVDDDAAMAREIARVLRDAGRAYVGSVFKRRWAWYFYRNGGHWRLEPTHVREYTSLDDYREIFSRGGLDVLGTYTEPMRFPLGEAVLRVLVRLRLVPANAFYEVHAGSRVLRALSGLRVRIPGYYGCWVTLQKPANVAA